VWAGDSTAEPVGVDAPDVVVLLEESDRLALEAAVVERAESLDIERAYRGERVLRHVHVLVAERAEGERVGCERIRGREAKVVFRDERGTDRALPLRRAGEAGRLRRVP